MPPKNVAKAAVAPKPAKVRKAAGAKGYQKPAPIPKGEILTDMSKQQWTIGPSIGSGGFGEIYSACKTGSSQKADDYTYVVKIEPHGNGPLFVEMHFYMRNAKIEDISSFQKSRGLKSLGMPHFVGNGSHDLDNIKHRFIVMPRYGRDVWSNFLENGRKLPQHTVYRIALQMLDVLEYIHNRTYVHADIKGANILLGYGKNGGTQSYLVDFGLASHYTTKDFKPDPKKMHNGTIEYTSRDAHNGVPTMRSDLEILGYNLIHWSGVTLPWDAANLLASPVKVQNAKEDFMKDTGDSLKKCFGSDVCPTPILSFFTYVSTLKFDSTPDYTKCRKLFESGLKSLGKANSGDLEFKFTKSAVASASTSKNNVPAKKTKKEPAVAAVDDSDGDFDKTPKKSVKKTKPLPIKKEEKIPSIEISDSEDEKVVSKSPNRNNRKRNVSKGDDSPESKKSRQQNGQSKHDTPDTNSAGIIVKNELSSKGSSKKHKTYQFNLELDVSLDANIVVNVRRKDKSKNQKKADKNETINSDEEVPPSQESTPVMQVKVSKKKVLANGSSSHRKSPRTKN